MDPTQKDLSFSPIKYYSGKYFYIFIIINLNDIHLILVKIKNPILCFKNSPNLFLMKMKCWNQRNAFSMLNYNYERNYPINIYP
jgi:hypothetical protein